MENYRIKTCNLLSYSLLLFNHSFYLITPSI